MPFHAGVRVVFATVQRVIVSIQTACVASRELVARISIIWIAIYPLSHTARRLHP
jgi:hypothetical protein